MNLAEKHKATLKAAEILWSLPNDEVDKILELLEQRKKLHASLYGASLNRKTGATEQRLKATLRENAQQVKNWASSPVAAAAPDETTNDQHDGTW